MIERVHSKMSKKQLKYEEIIYKEILNAVCSKKSQGIKLFLIKIYLIKNFSKTVLTLLFIQMDITGGLTFFILSFKNTGNIIPNF